VRLFTLWSAVGLIAAAAPLPAPSAGNGTIYLGSYSRHIIAIDEATEQPTTRIPLKTGLPWSVHLSSDRTQLYIENADQEHIEIVDLATRQSVDTFTLSESNKKVRILGFAADPQHRFMILVTKTATKLVDRFEIGTANIVQYDLKSHKVVQSVPWSTDPEPQYFFINLRFSPDGRFLFAFARDILVFDATTLKVVDTWNLSLPNERGLGRFDLASIDETNDDPGYFTGLLTMEDPVEHRRLLVVGRINLTRRSLDYFPIGPAPEQGEVSFALGAGRTRGYVLVQNIGHNELWTIDMSAKRVVDQVPFGGRPRMALRSSSNGKVLYIFEAGNTIDLYDVNGFKYLRTITLDTDMTYDSFHVVGPETTTRSAAR
jgi:DNA-binding beta-propeller fold protein YncE